MVVSKHLDYILSSARHDAPLRHRIEWLSDLLAWVRKGAEGMTASTLSAEPGKIQAARIRFVFQVLSRNSEWQSACARTIRSVIHDTDAIELFSHLGLPTEMGLFNEIVDRVMLRSMPIPPGEDDLGEVFNEFFPQLEDADWIRRLEVDVLAQIVELCYHEVDEQKEQGWNTLQRDMEEALMILVGQVETTGLSYSIRKRLSTRRIQEIPFYQLSRVTHKMIQTFSQEDLGTMRSKLDQYIDLLGSCEKEIAYAYEHLADFGVSLNIVYQLDRLEQQIARIRTLIDLLVSEEMDFSKISRFLGALITESYERHHIKPLIDENLSILSRRIADRHAEKGESYFTRTAGEYFKMLKKAGGGGIITGFTVLLKELIYLLHLGNFWNGFLLASNYAASFVFIQLANCTLATKQPAMTAPALAAKMHALNDEKVFGSLVREMINLIRSQSAAVFGNVLMVVPSILLIFFVLFYGFGWDMLGEERATVILQEHNLIGWTPIFAAITGVFLWLASVFAGLFDNWLAYRQIPTAISASRKLQSILGVSGAEKVGTFLKTHGTGVAGSVALGFLLGVVPQVFSFFGIGLEVRHVTLATGTIALAIGTLGVEAIWASGFWLAVLGIVAIGFFNVSVSFALALSVAMKARRVKPIDRNRLYKSLLRRILRNPLAIFFPIGIGTSLPQKESDD